MEQVHQMIILAGRSAFFTTPLPKVIHLKVLHLSFDHLARLHLSSCPSLSLLSHVFVAAKQSATCKTMPFLVTCQLMPSNVSCFLWSIKLNTFAYHWLISVDPRSENWPLVSSPWPVASILAFYVYFVKFWGPKWMQNRPAYDVRAILIVYNIIVAILSAWFFYEGGRVTYFSGKYSLLCQPIDFSPTGDAMRTVEISHRFMLLKMFELLDTVFFILKKNFHQVSNLHVIHHFLVFGGSALGVRIGAGGHGTFLPLINCFVHVIMYTYYCLSAMGPRVQKYLWWKKYLTQLQIAQFIVGGIHAIFPIYFDCGYPKYLSHLILYVTFLFLCLFANFYLKNYLVNHASHHRKEYSSAKDQWTLRPRIAASSRGPFILASQLATGHKWEKRSKWPSICLSLLHSLGTLKSLSAPWACYCYIKNLHFHIFLHFLSHFCTFSPSFY